MASWILRCVWRINMRIKSLCLAIAAVIMLTGATNWDGAATIDSSGDLPPESHAIATNAFPRNAVVDVTNLENHRTIRVIVASGLPSSGLLATLSRSAAEALGFQDNFVYRIRMIQPPDAAVFSFLRERGLSTVDTNNAPITIDLYVEIEIEEEDEFEPNEFDLLVQDTETEDELPDEPEQINSEPYEEDPLPDEWYLSNLHNEQESPPALSEAPPDILPESSDQSSDDEHTLVSVASESSDDSPGTTDSDQENEQHTTEKILNLIPSEERIPEGPEIVIAPEDIVPPLDPLPATEQGAEHTFITVTQPPEIPATEAESTSLSGHIPFQPPIISELEHGKWYIQVAAFLHLEQAENETRQIGTDYPLVIQQVETNSTLFRVLLGPLMNQGESNAMLQRIKSIGYTDAFTRNG